MYLRLSGTLRTIMKKFIAKLRNVAKSIYGNFPYLIIEIRRCNTQQFPIFIFTPTNPRLHMRETDLLLRFKYVVNDNK